MATIKSFKNTGVLVFANSKSDYSKLPAGVKEVRKKAGNTIPMLFVLSADGEKGITALPYATLKGDSRKAARKLKKELNELKEKAEEEAQTQAKKDSAPLAPLQTWTNAEGKAIKASVTSATKDTVEFKIKGKTVSYPMEKLSDDSRQKIEALIQ